MSNNNTPATGVTGNTPQQAHNAAGTQATSGLVTFWKAHNRKVILLMAAMALVIAVYVYTSAGVRVGGLILTGFIIRHVAMKFGKNPNMTWGSVLGYVGMTIIAITLLTTSFVQKPLEIINFAEQELDEVEVADLTSINLTCPGTFSVDETLIVQRGCTTEVSGTIPAGSNFLAMDGRFDGALTQYVDIEQPFPGFYTLTPNQDFPEGDDEVEVRIIDQEETMQRSRAAEVSSEELSPAAASLFE